MSEQISNYAPVAIFAYKRLKHLEQTVSALMNNKLAHESDLYVFSDAPKNLMEEGEVAAVREFIRNISGFRSVTLIARTENFGLSRNITDGVSQLCKQYGKVIVLEDDLVTSPHFLTYMNDGLARYIDDDRVISIHGYVYPATAALPETFFLYGADCWGWATWQRAWRLFESDGQRLLAELKAKRMIRKFNYDGAYPHLKILRQQICGQNDSWAILWHATACVNRKLTLYPGRSLVDNIGLDQSGTHCGTGWFNQASLAQNPILVDSIPVEENREAREVIVRFLHKARWKRYWKLLMRRIKVFHYVKRMQ